MLTNRMPSFPSVAAGFCILLLLNLTAPHTHTSKSRMPTIPTTSPPKKVPPPREALAAVHVAGKKKTQLIYKKNYANGMLINAWGTCIES